MVQQYLLVAPFVQQKGFSAPLMQQYEPLPPLTQRLTKGAGVGAGVGAGTGAGAGAGAGALVLKIKNL